MSGRSIAPSAACDFCAAEASTAVPAHDYDCAACGRRFEVTHGLHADRPTTCPLCGGGPVRKAISAPAIHYRGSGWAKKERNATATSKATGEKSSKSTDEATESTPASSTPDTASSPKTNPTPASPATTAD
ncbi:MAG: hypothetical protein E4H24_05520 [Thermomicrobiales bacterium]|nr:MAG: hypothetical protein E4H24_05520 [Thermomicrobiales bacterium]